jgi:hypothetical protein
MALEEAASVKESAVQAKRQRALDRDSKKAVRAEEKATKVEKQYQKQEEKQEKDRLNDYWKDVAAQGWGNNLQKLVKSNRPPLPGSYVGRYCGTVPPQCIYNQRVRCLKLKFQKQGRHPGLVAPMTGPPSITQAGFPTSQLGINQYQNSEGVLFFAPGSGLPRRS